MRGRVMLVWLAACHGPARVDHPGDVQAGEPIAARRVRLLNRTEYLNTVQALFPQLGSGTCAVTPDCNLSSQSCSGTTCVADACPTHTFTLRSPTPRGGEVVVAGSFNGWASAAAAGGLAMTWVADQGIYYAKAEVADGTWAYKYVIDGSTWITDPDNPHTTPDGFGGDNSVLVMACAGAAPPSDGAFDPTSGFPPDSRPEGFPFDTHADAAVVSATRAEAWLASGQAIAERLVTDVDQLLGCSAADDGCVRTWVVELGSRAFRRSLSGAEVDHHVGLVQASADRKVGVSIALQAMLSSPDFLYRTEVGTPAGDRYVLTMAEAASAMSYFLWGGPPDDLLTAAVLSDGSARAEQAERMLADPRARPALRRFAAQWLGIEPVLTADKSPTLFPEVVPALRAEMLAETQDVVERVVFEGGGRYRDLLLADWTLAGPSLRELYGLPPGAGEVSLSPERAGILGHASILSTTAHSDQSSPIRRGLFVRQRLLCESFPPPPPTAGGVPDVDPTATTRERFAQHTDNEACRSCHQYIDPLGFGFEPFDAIGRFRTEEGGLPIDASGAVIDVEGRGTGTEQPFQDLAGLGGLLAASEAGPRCFVTQMVRYALGVEVAPDDPRIQSLVAGFQSSGHDIRRLMVDVAASALFVERAP